MFEKNGLKVLQLNAYDDKPKSTRMNYALYSEYFS